MLNISQSDPVEKGLKGGSLEKRAGTGNTGGGRSGPPAPHPPPPPSDYGASLVPGSGGTSDLLFSSLAEWYVTVFHYR